MTENGSPSSSSPGKHVAPLSPQTRGISLPQRRASVTIHRRLSLNEDEQLQSSVSRRGSLEDTRDFYNVRPTSLTNNVISRLSRGNMNLAQLREQPTAADSGSSMATSPPRVAAPLPTPRAFLTPKKPAAAIRHEQQLKHQPQPHAPLPTQASRASVAEDTLSISQRSEEYGVSPEPVSLDAMVAGGPLENRYIQPSRTEHSLGQSMTDMSTPRRPPRELSSDNLMSTLHGEKAPNQPTQQRQGKPERKWRKLENPQSTWFAGGRLMTGGDNWWSFVFTAVIILGLTGVWLGTTGVWLWNHGSEYGLATGGGVAVVIILVYLFGLVISSLIAAAFRDPGIIPRNLDPDPPVSQVESWYEADNREMMVKNGKVIVKYCETCKTYRPPRCSHCRLCGNCIDGIDHHCSYIHTCVGKRNYLAFLTLLVSGTISAIYIVVFSAIHFYLLCRHDDISFKDALSYSPGAAVSFLLGVLILPGVLFLLWYHFRLLIYNLTTVEQIRASASTNLFRARKRPDNPFEEDSRLSNILLASLARPHFPSWIDASGWDMPDTRAVNPALTDPKWATQTV